jgi:3-oxoacyl-[acyl-carrier protein] reductase
LKLELENKVVVITGGTGGIGAQIVTDFLEEGAVVVCLIRNMAKFENMQNFIEGQGLNLESLHYEICDLKDYTSIKKAVNIIARKHQKINVLVNCAGYTLEAPFALLEKEQIGSIVDLNLTSPMYVSHAVLRYMFKQKGGSIVNVSSVSAVKKGRGVVAYASAKAGLENFTRTLSQEVGKKNIRVNCVRPGVVDTTMSEALLDRSMELIKSDTAVGRPGIPKEISKTVLFLASNVTSSYITGECIGIDGGLY